MKFFLTLFLFGCETREGVSFKQTLRYVELKKPEVVVSTKGENAEKIEDKKDAFVLTSEEAAENFEGKSSPPPAPDDGSQSGVLTIDLKSENVPSMVPSPSNDSKAAAQMKAPAPTSDQGEYAFSWKDWPIQVMKVMPEFHPPRALVSLPSGQELVVSAGKMLPEHNLVVMSVSKAGVDFVQIDANGDRAKVKPLRLVPQK